MISICSPIIILSYAQMRLIPEAVMTGLVVRFKALTPNFGLDLVSLGFSSYLNELN